MRSYKIIPGASSYYFTTSTIVSWLCVFKEKKYFEIIIDSLKYCQENKGLKILGFVIMLNHVHMITFNIEGTNLSDIMRDFKRYTSRKISGELEKDYDRLFLYVFRKAAERQNRKEEYKVWQDNFHPILINSDEFFRQKLTYMHHNPVRKGMISKPEDWLYSSARNFILEDDSIIKLDMEYI